MAKKSLLESRLGKDRDRPEVDEKQTGIRSIRTEQKKRKPEKRPREGRKNRKILHAENPAPQVIEYEQSIQEGQLLPETEREAEEKNRQNKAEKKVTRHKKKGRVLTAVLAAACAYLIFLIYGVLMTSYTYDEQGNVVAEIYSVEDIRQRNAFEKVVGYYQLCRGLYEEILLTDYQFEAQELPYATIGGQYTALLDSAESLYSQINGASVDSQYYQIIDMMATWLTDYVRNYLQNIATYCAYNGEDDTSGNNAIVYNTETYQYFLNITQNIVSLGEGIHGIDLTDIREWSPETYIDQEINGTS